MNRSLIEGKVAQILNERQIAINRGTAHGVERGMKFRVLAASPLPIVDPDSGDELGVEDMEKVTVKVVRVHENYAVCSTYRQMHSSWMGIMGILQQSGALLSSPGSIKETLRVDDEAHIPELSAEESYVRIGDRVIELIEVDAVPNHIGASAD